MFTFSGQFPSLFWLPLKFKGVGDRKIVQVLVLGFHSILKSLYIYFVYKKKNCEGVDFPDALTHDGVCVCYSWRVLRYRLPPC